MTPGRRQPALAHHVAGEDVPIVDQLLVTPAGPGGDALGTERCARL